MRCKNPFFVQIEQLQSRASWFVGRTRKRTLPQWQAPSFHADSVMRGTLASITRTYSYHARGLARPTQTEPFSPAQRLLFRVVQKIVLLVPSRVGGVAPAREG